MTSDAKIQSIKTISSSDAGATVRRAQADEFSMEERSQGYLAEATATHFQTGSTYFVIGSGRVVVQWLFKGMLFVRGHSTYNRDRAEAQQEATVFDVHEVIQDVCNQIREQSLADMLMVVTDQAILRHVDPDLEIYMLRDRRTRCWHHHGEPQEWSDSPKGGSVWTDRGRAQAFAEAYPKNTYDVEVVPISVKETLAKRLAELRKTLPELSAS